MNAPILVTGGTGTIGSRVVPMLREAGRNVRILSRHPREDEPGIQHVEGDTVAGRALARALGGVDVVLHLAGGAKGDDIAAKNLAIAAKDAGVQHLILISVVGADRMPIGYFRAKAEAERAIAESGVPWTVLRAAQLHEFVVPLVRGLSKLPLLLAPGGLRFEPVHVNELADIYVDAMGGRQRRSLPVRIPGAVGRAYRAGDNLTGGNSVRGTRGWREFLSELREKSDDGPYQLISREN